MNSSNPITDDGTRRDSEDGEYGGTDQRHEETWHNGENGEAGGTEEHREEEDADSGRPSKRAKVLAVIGKRNTAK